MLFGAQIRQAGGLLAALRRAEAMGAEVMQVFPQSPRQWRYPEANAERSVAFGRAWPASPIVRRAALHRSGCRLLLENTAGAGGTIGRSFEELARVIGAAGDDSRLGVCLDTQHAWAAGMSFGTVAAADALVAEIDRTVGLERLACLHLNDSKVVQGAGVDRHDNVGRGHIGPTPFRALLGHPALQGLPAVLEVPGTDHGGPDAHELAVVRRLHAEGLALRSPSTAAPAPHATASRSTSPRPSRSRDGRGSVRSRRRS